MLSTRRKVLACLMALLMVGLTGCGSLLRQPAPTDRPPPLFEGFSDVRYYPLDRDMPLPSSVDAAYVDEPRDAYEQRPDGSHVYRYLAVSELYVIGNDRLDAQPRTVNRTLGSISPYSIDSMLKVSRINDLYTLYVGDISGELELHCIATPQDYVPSSTEELNQQEMIRQYDLGHKMAVDGIPWQRLPPGYRV